MAQAQQVTGGATKKETVRVALETLVQLRRQGDLRQLRGSLHWEGDLESMRRNAS